VSSFERVVLPHLDAAYTLARYLVREPADVEDALQEAILRAVRYFPSLKNESEARAWLLAIVRRECYSTWNRRREQAETVSLDSVLDVERPPLSLIDGRESPEALAERSSLRRRIIQAVDALPEKLREVIVLRELQQCSYEEIASIVEAPLGTVMSRLSRARSRLAESLRDVADIGASA
jgi:RNA polymerase sigma-70 factor (ECF subfamily)